MHRDERILATEQQKVRIVEDELLLALDLETHLEFLAPRSSASPVKPRKRWPSPNWLPLTSR